MHTKRDDFRTLLLLGEERIVKGDESDARDALARFWQRKRKLFSSHTFSTSSSRERQTPSQRTTVDHNAAKRHQERSVLPAFQSILLQNLQNGPKAFPWLSPRPAANTLNSRRKAKGSGQSPRGREGHPQGRKDHHQNLKRRVRTRISDGLLSI